MSLTSAVTTEKHTHTRIVPLLVIVLLGFCGLHASILWLLRDQIDEGYGDFASFYTAGTMVARGESAKLYDPPTQWKVQQEFASTVKTRRGPLPYVRPPFEALLFVPLSWLRYPTALLVWSVLKIALLTAIAFFAPVLSASGATTGFRILRALVGVAFFAVGIDLLQGQDSILLLLIFVLVARFLMREAYFYCGLMLALGLFKPHLVIPVLLILAVQRGGRKVIAGFVTGAIPLFLVSLVMVHWSGVFRYPQYLWTLNQIPGMGMVRPDCMPNIRGLAAVVFPEGASSLLMHAVLVALVVLGIVLAARVWRRFEGQSILVTFSFLILVVLMTSYYGYGYDLTLLLLPLWFVGELLLTRPIEGWAPTTFMATTGLLLFTPMHWAAMVTIKHFAYEALLMIPLGMSVYEIARGWRIVGEGIAENQLESRIARLFS